MTHQTPRLGDGDEVDVTPPTQAQDVNPSGAAVRRELSGRLAGLSLPRQVYVLAVWPLLEQVLNFLVGTTDLALAGRLTPPSLAVAATDALGVAGYIGWLIGMVQSAVGIGTAALVSRAIGGRHRRLANAALGQSMILGLSLGLLIGAVVYAAAPLIGRFAELGDEALPLCVTYLRIVSLTAPFSALLFIGAAALRASGDTRSPFTVMLIVNLINIGASVLFTFGPAPVGGHGVAGIAYGTALAWVSGCAIILTVLLRGGGGIRLHTHRLRPHAHTLWRIARVGVPSLLETSGMWVGNFLVLKAVGLIGARDGIGAIGTHMIAVRLESISYLPGFAVGIAAATLTGQYMGLGDVERAKQAVRLCWLVGVVVMGLMGVMFMLIPGPLVALISAAPEHRELAPTLLMVCGPIQIFFATYAVLSQALRGAGDTRSAMMMTYASTYLVRLPAVYVVGIVMGYGLPGVWVALCGELVLRGCLFAGRFAHGGWVKVKV